MNIFLCTLPLSTCDTFFLLHIRENYYWASNEYCNRYAQENYENAYVMDNNIFC